MDESLFQVLLELVSEQRKQRAERFLRREDAWRSVLGEALARYCIGQRESISSHEVRFAINEQGKPFTQTPGRTHFNISHSGSWIVCALDERPVGVDVERIHAIEFDIAKRFFSPKEYEDLSCLSGQAREERFFEYWTLKESYIKAIGKGLSCPLSSFTIVLGNGRIAMSVEKQMPLLLFKQYDLGAGYKCALCASHENFPREILRVRPEELTSPLRAERGGYDDLK